MRTRSVCFFLWSFYQLLHRLNRLSMVITEIILGHFNGFNGLIKRKLSRIWTSRMLEVNTLVMFLQVPNSRAGLDGDFSKNHQIRPWHSKRNPRSDNVHHVPMEMKHISEGVFLKMSLSHCLSHWSFEINWGVTLIKQYVNDHKWHQAYQADQSCSNNMQQRMFFYSRQPISSQTCRKDMQHAWTLIKLGVPRAI